MAAEWYEIRVRGELGADWADWFDRVEIRRENENETTLIGPVVDQADLHGRLARIRNLNLDLISVSLITRPNDPSSRASRRRDPMMVVCTIDPGVPGSTDWPTAVRDSTKEGPGDAQRQQVRPVVISYSHTGNNDAIATAVAAALGGEHRRVAERGKRSMMRIVLDVLLRRSPVVEVDLSGIAAEDRVILVGPVWMGKVATPFRRILPELGRRGSQIAYVSVCGGADGPNTQLESDLRVQLGRDDVVVIERYLADLIGREKHPTRDDTMEYRIDGDEVMHLCRKIVGSLDETAMKRSDV